MFDGSVIEGIDAYRFGLPSHIPCTEPTKLMGLAVFGIGQGEIPTRWAFKTTELIHIQWDEYYFRYWLQHVVESGGTPLLTYFTDLQTGEGWKLYQTEQRNLRSLFEKLMENPSRYFVAYTMLMQKAFGVFVDEVNNTNSEFREKIRFLPEIMGAISIQREELRLLFKMLGGRISVGSDGSWTYYPFKASLQDLIQLLATLCGARMVQAGMDSLGANYIVIKDVPKEVK